VQGYEQSRDAWRQDFPLSYFKTCLLAARACPAVFTASKLALHVARLLPARCSAEFLVQGGPERLGCACLQ
jgi:hypothetical protein